MTFSLLIIVTEHKQYFLREVGLKARVDDESDSDMTTVLLVLPKLHQNKLTNNKKNPLPSKKLILKTAIPK